MNLFTALFFEEHRLVTLYEDAINRKYPHLRPKSVFKKWLMGFCICYSYCKTKIKKSKKEKKGKGEELEAVNVLREKMKRQKQEKKKDIKNKQMGRI